jgi:hypothetical protein
MHIKHQYPTRESINTPYDKSQQVTCFVLNVSDLDDPKQVSCKILLHKKHHAVNSKYSCADTSLERKSRFESLESETNTVVKSPQKRDCKGRKNQSAQLDGNGDGTYSSKLEAKT